MLQATAVNPSREGDAGAHQTLEAGAVADAGSGEAIRYFKARLAAVAHEYAPHGLPVGSLRKKFSQVWRGHTIPSPSAFGLPPKTSLLRLLEHFDDTVTIDRTGPAGPVIRAVVSREAALGLAPHPAPPSPTHPAAEDPPAGRGADGSAAKGSAEHTQALPDGASLPSGGALAGGLAGASRTDVGRDAHVRVGRSLCGEKPTAIIVGGGIGGIAAAVALQSHGIRCLVFERDEYCEQRRGYGLTLSNAVALAALGLEDSVRNINRGCVSNCHWVFNGRGEVLGYFGIAFTRKLHVQRGNLRVPRVVLRKLLSERLAPGTIQWGWKLRRYEEDADRRGVTAHFERATPSVEGGGGPATVVEHTARGDVLIGADGVRSVVRSLKFGDAHRYVGIVVVLGVSDHQDPLTREQGFYTVDGTHRMFTMPYEPIEEEEEEEADARADARTHGADAAGRHTTMWQLSFAEADEARARALTDRGGEALLAEVRQRCAKWHSPVPAMLAATAASSVWGTLLVDRAAMPLRKKNRDDTSAPWRSRVTLVGDAAHCMTPFKGQGANQALADAPLLAKYLGPALCEPEHVSRLKVPSALSKFEREMGDRAEAKVVASREAAGNYHSKAALEPGSYGIEGIPIERMADFLTTLRERGVGAESGAELEQRAIEIAAEMCDLPS